MTLREVLANRARRRMRLARESREETPVRPSHRRRLIESLEARRQNRFFENREAARMRNHYILVEDENEDDLVEIEPDTSVTVDVTADEQPVEKEDVVRTLQDLASQLGYDITPKAEEPAPVAEPAPAEVPAEEPVPAEPAPVDAPVEEPVAPEVPAEEPAPVADAPVEAPAEPAPEVKPEDIPAEESKECPEGECQEAKKEEAAPVEATEPAAEGTTEVKEADGDDEGSEDDEPKEEEPAEDEKSDDEGSDEGSEEASDEGSEDDAESSEEDSGEDAPVDPEQETTVGEISDKLSNWTTDDWNAVLGDILSGKSSEE